VQALDRLASAEMITVGYAARARPCVFLGQFVGLQNLLDASDIDGGGFLDKHVLLRLHARQCVVRMEARGTGDQHDVAVFDDGAIPVQPAELSLARDLNAVREHRVSVLRASAILSGKMSAAARAWCPGRPSGRRRPRRAASAASRQGRA